MTCVLSFLYSFPVYFISLGYCLWRLTKRYDKTSLDGVIGVTPALDTFGVVFFPFLYATVDVVVTVYNWVVKRKRNGENTL